MSNRRNTYIGAFLALVVERVSEPLVIGRVEWRLVAYWQVGLDLHRGDRTLGGARAAAGRIRVARGGQRRRLAAGYAVAELRP